MFLSNGVEAAPATHATLYALGANIAAASTAAAAGGPTSSRLMSMTGRATAPFVGRTNMQMRFASGLPHARICHGNVRGAFAVHSRGAKPRRAARFPERPIDHARTEPRRDRMRDPDDVSLSGDSFAEART